MAVSTAPSQLWLRMPQSYGAAGEGVGRALVVVVGEVAWVRCRPWLQRLRGCGAEEGEVGWRVGEGAGRACGRGCCRGMSE